MNARKLIRWFSNMALPIPTGLFANAPFPVAGKEYFATDLGQHGIMIVGDGVKWKPSSGKAVLYMSGVQTSVHTGDTSEVNLAVVTIPAKLVSATGGLLITFQGADTGTAAAKTFAIRWGTSSGAVSGNYLIHQLQATAAGLSFAGIRQIWARGATNSQIIPAYNGADAGSSSGGDTLTAIDTTAVSYLNFNGQLVTGTDSISYDAIQVEWLEY